MKKINKNEEIFSKKIDNLNLKFRIDSITNKKYVYIKYLDRISGKNKEIDNYAKIGNWVEIRSETDCKNKLDKCLRVIVKSLCDEALEVLEKQLESLNFEKNKVFHNRLILNN